MRDLLVAATAVIPSEGEGSAVDSLTAVRNGVVRESSSDDAVLLPLSSCQAP